MKKFLTVLLVIAVMFTFRFVQTFKEAESEHNSNYAFFFFYISAGYILMTSCTTKGTS